MKINNFDEFINEEFFKRIFNNSKRKTNTKLSRIESCVENILNFLAENDIYNWDKFLNMSPFDRDVINKLIDSEVRDYIELNEVKFRLRLELSNREQLLEYKNELEQNEEYEN
jgi:hypothetical protein